MFEDEKQEKLDRLYSKLDELKNKKDQRSVMQRKKIRLEIKELKNIITTEEFEKMMQERREIDTGRC